MGMYCCCGNKITLKDFVCDCDWDGWISTSDWPPERKNKHITIIETPASSGKYLARFCDGDRFEKEVYFSIEPLKMEKIDYFGTPFIEDLHWKDEDGYIDSPYAWKKIEETEKQVNL